MGVRRSPTLQVSVVSRAKPSFRMVVTMALWLVYKVPVELESPIAAHRLQALRDLTNAEYRAAFDCLVVNLVKRV